MKQCTHFWLLFRPQSISTIFVLSILCDLIIHGLSGYSVVYSLLHSPWLASLIAAFFVEQVMYHISGLAAGTGCIFVFIRSCVVVLRDLALCHIARSLS